MKSINRGTGSFVFILIQPKWDKTADRRDGQRVGERRGRDPEGY